MARLFPNGIGESLGDHLITGAPLQASGQVWFVSYVSGTDAASPRGLDREAPLKTLAQAIVNAADNDIVVLLDTQTITGTVNISKRLAVIGSGLSGGIPVSGIQGNLAAGNVLTISTSACELRNLRIKAHQQANATDRISVTASDFAMVGCYLECAGNDLADALSLDSGADRAAIMNTTFISTATSVASRPVSALSNSAVLADVRLDGLTVSGGAVGFSGAYAVDFSAAAISRLKAQSVSLLLGADMKLNALTTGWVNVDISTGSARLEW